MTLQPYPSRTKLCALAREDGLVVSREDDKTVIDNGDLALFFSAESDIKDKSNKVYSVQEAFTALGVELR